MYCFMLIVSLIFLWSLIMSFVHTGTKFKEIWLIYSHSLFSLSMKISCFYFFLSLQSFQDNWIYPSE